MGLFAAVVVVFLSVAQSAPGSSPKPSVAETAHLTVSTSASVAKASSGAKISLFVDIAPKPEMHVYAPGEKDAVPVAVTLEPDATVKPGAPAFPAAEKYFFAPLNLTQLVYSKPFRITQPVTVASSSGTLTIKGTLAYQACDDKVCYRLTRVPLSWTVRIQ